MQRATCGTGAVGQRGVVRGRGGNHFKIRNSCCLFEKLLAHTQREHKNKKRKKIEDKKNVNFFLAYQLKNLENALQKNMLNKCEFFEISQVTMGLFFFVVFF